MVGFPVSATNNAALEPVSGKEVHSPVRETAEASVPSGAT